jgi:hypothetical protein
MGTQTVTGRMQHNTKSRTVLERICSETKWKTTAFWGMKPWGLVEVDKCFRSVLLHYYSALIMEAVRIPETPAYSYLYQTSATSQKAVICCHLHSHCRPISHCFQSLRLVCSSSHELLIFGISVRIFLMQWFPFAFCMIVFRHTVGLLWTSDQPVSETSTCTT